MDTLRHPHPSPAHHDPAEYLPRVRRVSWLRPFHWLAAGAADAVQHPGLSLGLGTVFSLGGVLIFLLTRERPDLMLAAISGFLLVGPLLAVGFYEISRRLAGGDTVSLVAVCSTLAARWRSLALFGVFLTFLYAVWSQLTAALVAYLLGDDWIRNTEALLREIFVVGEHPQLAALWLLSGATLAAVTFLLSVVTAPLLLDREMEVHRAMATSVDVVAENLPAMLLWSFLIVVLTLVGFATLLTGMVLIMPLLGHATWHAYADLVE